MFLILKSCLNYFFVYSYVVVFMVQFTLAVEIDKINCGIDPEIKVSEGDVEIDKYPWVGILYYQYSGESGEVRAITTVALIHTEFCIAPAADIGPMPKRNFRRDTRVMLGHDWRLVGRRVRNYVLHPEYGDTINTVALVQLKDILRQSSIKPLCPPPSRLTNPLFYVVKFKDQDFTRLQKEVIPVDHVPGEMCKDFYVKTNLNSRKHRPPFVACAISKDAEKICVWEAGAALVSRDIWGRWMLLGLGVRGPGCAAPSRYLDLMSYQPWIEDSLQQFQRLTITRLNQHHFVLRQSEGSMSRFGACDPEETVNLIYRDTILLKTDTDRYNFFTYNMSIYDSVTFTCLTLYLENATSTSEMTVKHFCNRNAYGPACYKYKSSIFMINVNIMFNENCILDMHAWGYHRNMTLIDKWAAHLEEGSYYADFTMEKVEYRGNPPGGGPEQTGGFEPLDEKFWVPEFDQWTTTPFDNTSYAARYRLGLVASTLAMPPRFQDMDTDEILGINKKDKSKADKSKKGDSDKGGLIGAMHEAAFGPPKFGQAAYGLYEAGLAGPWPGGYGPGGGPGFGPGFGPEGLGFPGWHGPGAGLGPDGKPGVGGFGGYGQGGYGPFGPDGKPIPGAGGFDPYGKPLYGTTADGKPYFGGIGPNGEPLPGYGPFGPAIGKDGKPMLDANGKPIPAYTQGQGMVDSDGKPYVPLGPDGIPIVPIDEDGWPILGPDGLPISGIGPDGKPILDENGRPIASAGFGAASGFPGMGDAASKGSMDKFLDDLVRNTYGPRKPISIPWQSTTTARPWWYGKPCAPHCTTKKPMKKKTSASTTTPPPCPWQIDSFGQCCKKSKYLFRMFSPFLCETEYLSDRNCMWDPSFSLFTPRAICCRVNKTLPRFLSLFGNRKWRPKDCIRLYDPCPSGKRDSFGQCCRSRTLWYNRKVWERLCKRTETGYNCEFYFNVRNRQTEPRCCSPDFDQEEYDKARNMSCFKIDPEHNCTSCYRPPLWPNKCFSIRTKGRGRRISCNKVIF